MKRVLLIGDKMIDKIYHLVDAGQSQEAPIRKHAIHNERMAHGGATNVYYGLAALGVDVTMVEIRMSRITTKHRYFCEDKMVLRMDDDHFCSSQEMIDYRDKFLEMVPHYDIVVFSDYGKGALYYVEDMIRECRRLGKKSIVDPKGTWEKYMGASIIKCNNAEFNQAGLEADEHPLVICTNGGGDTALIVDSHWNSRIMFYPPKIDSVDPTGAGDSFLCGLVYKLAQEEMLGKAIPYANAAGAAACLHVGTHIVTKEEIQNVLNNAHILQSSAP